MSAPDNLNYVQAGFMIAGFFPMWLGARTGIAGSGSVRWQRREQITFPLIWAGLAIWTVGAAFGVVTHILWFSLVPLILWSLITAGAGVLYWMALTLQRRIRRGEIHDYDDELRDRQEHK